MKVPLSWLKDYVDLTLPVEELAERLTLAGLEVGGIQYLGVEGAELPWARDKIFVGQILAVKPHPDADRLVLADVDYGGPQIETVVTGAPNLFPYLGQDVRHLNLKSPFALEGATLYDGHKTDGSKMVLKGRAIRGIMNRHMLCSEKELGISEEHEGILILDPEAPVGVPLVDYAGSAVLDIDLTPNMARAASIIGVAREVAALTGQTVRYPDYEDLPMEGPPVAGRVVIETAEPELNPRFCAVLIEGIHIQPSPYWMQLRLRLAGMRPINNVVDVSNYVMLEMGQPNHAFDYDVLRARADRYAGPGLPVPIPPRPVPIPPRPGAPVRGPGETGTGSGDRRKAPVRGPATEGRTGTGSGTVAVHIITRLARPGEQVTTLDGVERTMEPYTILVTDPAGPLSIGGIMGGAESEVHADSANILLEAAAWNFINIRRSIKAYDLPSEAGYRFSRGVHPSQALLGALRGAKLMQQLAGGTIAQGVVDYYPNPAQPVTVDLPLGEARRLLGIDLSLEQIQSILASLEFKCEVIRGAGNQVPDSLRVTVPDHRMDISTGVVGRADLVEEIARVYGYDRIPDTQFDDVMPPQRDNELLLREEKTRDLLVEAGLQEVITYRLTTPEREALLYPPGTPADGRPYVTLANPTSAERTSMRHSLVSSVLEVMAGNARHRERIQLFEIGPVFLPNPDELLPEEPRRLVIAISGPRDPQTWQTSDTSPVDFYDLKGIVEALLDGLRVSEIAFEPAEHATYYPGRVARLRVNGEDIGVLGQLHPLVQEAWDLPEDRPVLAAELDFEALSRHIPDSHRVRPVPRFPAIRQDIAVVVDDSTPAQQVRDAILTAGGRLLAGVQLFDVYRGEQIGSGKKSLAYALTFQAEDRTLTDEEVAKVQSRIVKKLAQELDASLRA